MQTQEEISNPLERKVELSVSRAGVESEVDKRLRRLAPQIRVQGFRPGKVPVKIVARKHGQQIRQEVLGEKLQEQFSEKIKQETFRIAGTPSFETKNAIDDQADYEFGVTFEIYPEFELGDLSGISINKPILDIGDEEVQKTLDILRKQRTVYKPADRPAQSGDRANIDYHGLIDGEEFTGNQADDYSVVLGSGHLLKDFDDAILGMRVGEEKTFDMTFPEDYTGKDVAGKKVTFTVKLNQLELPELPEVDDEFARSLGVADGDLDRMRSEIGVNLQREVSQRIRAKLKEQVMQALQDKFLMQVPNILIQQEVDRLIEDIQNTRSAHGLSKNNELPRERFLERAEQRVRLGLVLAKLIEENKLEAKPEQIRQYVEEHAQGYENPEQVVQWHYASPERLKDIEPLVLEDNVVTWILERANITDQSISFEELMGYPYTNNA